MKLNKKERGYCILDILRNSLHLKIIFLLLNLLSIPRSGYGRTGGRFDPGKNDCLLSAFEW